jgi:hypothetical protein
MVPPQTRDVYKYADLDKDHIRVAVVDSGTPETVLKVALYHRPIDRLARTPYFAISYTWGDISIKTAILCGGGAYEDRLESLCSPKTPAKRNGEGVYLG